MKHHIVTTGIVLTRVDYGEADRILTILTPDHGKLRVIAKGVRKPKSKLAGGIELLSVCELSIMPSRGEIQTLVSSRLVQHYGDIVKDIRRTLLAYDMLKRVNRVTEDAAGEEYVQLLRGSLEGLNEHRLSVELVELWFAMKLLRAAGQTPVLHTDSVGQALVYDRDYVFDFDEMSFRPHEGGPYGVRHIKLIRIAEAAESASVLLPIKDAHQYASDALRLASQMLALRLRI